MAPNRKSVMGHLKDMTETKRTCPCVDWDDSSGICELKVWQGTEIDGEAVKSKQRLLSPGLQTEKYRGGFFNRIFGGGPLYQLIILSWPLFIIVLIAVYCTIVLLFAAFYNACHRDSPGEGTSARFYINLSFQTMSTIGYGTVFPDDVCSNWVSTLESWVSMILMSFITGLAFAKFARPHANIMFSDVFTVSKSFDGALELRFRVVNSTERKQVDQDELLDVNMKVILMRIEKTKHGESKLCYYNLKLQSSKFICLRLDGEVIHRVTRTSPFYGMTQEQVLESDFVLILMVSGLDANISDTVYQQKEYGVDEMRWGCRFKPAVSWDSRKECAIMDFSKVSAVSDAPLDSDDYATDVQDSPDNQNDSGESTKWPFWNLLGAENGEDSTETDTDTDSDMPAENGTRPENTNYLTSEIEKARTDDTQRQVNKAQDNCDARPPLQKQEDSHATANDKQHAPLAYGGTKVRFKRTGFHLFDNGLYYRALESSWLTLLVIITVVYVAALFIFALIAYAVPVTVVNKPVKTVIDSDFLMEFFWVVQTISTIGYGDFSPYPNGDFVNFYVVVLIVAGTIISTFLPGLAWSKFSKPRPYTLQFSDKLLLSGFHRRRAVMFRAANNRSYGKLVEGSFRLSVVIYNKRTRRRETHELRLVRNVWPIVQLGTTVMHLIDEDSPLYDLSTEDILSGRLYFVVLFSGIDSVICDDMYARKSYSPSDMIIGRQFVDNIRLAADGMHIDVAALNDTLPSSEADLKACGLEKWVQKEEQHIAITESPGEDVPSGDEDDKSPRAGYTAMRT